MKVNLQFSFKRKRFTFWEERLNKLFISFSYQLKKIYFIINIAIICKETKEILYAQENQQILPIKIKDSVRTVKSKFLFIKKGIKSQVPSAFIST
jgi:hypothetical protein